MEKIVLSASPRTVSGKRNAKLRREGKLPAVAYGHNVKPESLELDARAAEKAYHAAGGSKIVILKVGDGKPRNVLMTEVQREPLRGSLTHIDFYLVRMDELLKAEIPLHFIGESTAVYQGEGTLMKNLETIEVECLPGDLPDSIEVDISSLDDFEKSISVSDLIMPEGVKFTIEDIETLVAKIEPPRSDEEMAQLDEAITEELPEGVQEEAPVVVSERNEGDKDRRDKK